MPRAKRPKAAPKRESPVQFRPSGELARLLSDFAKNHGVARNEACRHLIAAALVGLDARHYPVVREMAAGAMAGAFIQACLHVHAALLAAARLEGKPLVEPRRSQFIVDTARDALAAKGLNLTATCSEFLPAEPPRVEPRDYGPAKRRIMRKNTSSEADALLGVVAGESAIGETEQAMSNDESVPLRVDG